MTSTQDTSRARMARPSATPSSMTMSETAGERGREWGSSILITLGRRLLRTQSLAHSPVRWRAGSTGESLVTEYEKL